MTVNNSLRLFTSQMTMINKVDKSTNNKHQIINRLNKNY